MSCETYYDTATQTIVPPGYTGDNLYLLSRLVWICNNAVEQGLSCDALPPAVAAYPTLFKYMPGPFTVNPLTVADFDIVGIDAYADILIELGERQPDGTDNFFPFGKWRYTRVGATLTCEQIEGGIYPIPFELPANGDISVGYSVMENTLPDYSYLARNMTFTRVVSINDPAAWVACAVPLCAIAPPSTPPVIRSNILLANHSQFFNPFGIQGF